MCCLSAAASALAWRQPSRAETASALPQPIYFWSSVTAPLTPTGYSYNSEVIRPPAIIMFADGSWDIDHLRWTGWGSSVAHATGISSASNGIPNQAQGRRIKSPARITLTSPGRFKGREVYRCFTLTIPAHATSDQQLCVTRAPGGTYYLGSTTLSLNDFLSPDGKVWCLMDSLPVSCFTGPPSAANPSQRGATLASDGTVTTCYVAVPSNSQACVQNWDTAAPVLRYGQRTVRNGIACTSATNGITCKVIAGPAAGKGFLISSSSAQRIGP